MTQRNKQARHKFHCFVLNSHFIQPSECKYVLCVCLSVRLQVSFIPLLFQIFWPEIFFPHSWSIEGKASCATQSRFSRIRIEIIFRGPCRARKLKSAKIIPMFLRLGNAKISHYTVSIHTKHDSNQSKVLRQLTLWRFNTKTFKISDLELKVMHWDWDGTA